MIRIDQTVAYNPVGTGHAWTNVKKKPVIVSAVEMVDDFEVHTLEGIMTGKPGDFLIRGIKGELYPCQRDIFLASYENL
jgi:hypothetical protein